jgi:hypothetical protein
MQLNPYLTFKGQCETAFKFYEKGPWRQNRGYDPPRGLANGGSGVT